MNEYYQRVYVKCNSCGGANICKPYKGYYVEGDEVPESMPCRDCDDGYVPKYIPIKPRINITINGQVQDQDIVKAIMEMNPKIDLSDND